jgi:hypothetical protein
MNNAQALTMPQIAQRLSVREEHIGFAARLGRLPAPVGRDSNGLLLFDAGAINSLLKSACPGANEQH